MWRKWFSKNVCTESNDLQEAYKKYIDFSKLPRHIAIIMDGNGRWAQKRGLPRTFGHKAGVEALRNIVKTASELGINVLTVYAFSTENWKRPRDEVSMLMTLFEDYLDSEIDELNENNVQIRFIGQIEELSAPLRDKIDRATGLTAANTGLIFAVAVNYGGRAEITMAVRSIANEVLAGKLQPEDITEEMVGKYLYTADLPDPDLLIRPSGDLRISNFLLWQVAYAEFWFNNTNWPDFKPRHLVEAIADYQNRDRRFGGLNK